MNFFWKILLKIQDFSPKIEKLRTTSRVFVEVSAYSLVLIERLKKA